MRRRRGKGRQADGDVFRALRCGVADPFAAVRDDGGTGSDLVTAVFRLVKRGDWTIGFSMSTVAEIESAIAKLPAEQVLSVAGWLDDYWTMIQTSENAFAQLDFEEGARS